MWYLVSIKLKKNINENMMNYRRKKQAEKNTPFENNWMYWSMMQGVINNWMLIFIVYLYFTHGLLLGCWGTG